tara:strand:- start:693 stop:1007 length:315 start_codon:yes stop_codon:yes gene_type:complete
MSIINNEMYINKITEIVNGTSASFLLSIPGVSEILIEFFNNDALDELHDDEINVDLYDNRAYVDGVEYAVTPTQDWKDLFDLDSSVSVRMTFGEFMEMKPQEVK